MIFDVNAWLGVWPFRSLRDNTPETLVARLDKVGIDKAAVAQIEGVFHRHVQSANEKLAEAVAPFRDRLVPVAVINPDYPGWEDDLRRCHEELGMKGVRIVPQYQGYDLSIPAVRRLAEACNERALSLAIPQRMEDTREHHWIDPGRQADLNAVADLVRAVPQTTYIIPNARGFQGSKLWQDEILRDKRWYVDLSLTELYYGLHRDVAHMGMIADFLNEGGTDHLVFGTHLPFTYAGCALVKRAVLDVDDETREEISCRRAERIFG